MTKEEKQILIKDLCGRLPYPILGLHKGEDLPLYVMDNSGSYMVLGYNAWFNLDTVPFKPYLRPMSSMTEEEKEEINAIIREFGNKWFEADDPEGQWNATFWEISEISDYLNSRFLDYRGLIPMGLALEATEGVY